MLGFLWRTMPKCPRNLKVRAYMTIVRPKVEYCASIWDPHHGKYRENIEKVQRKAVRFVTNKPHRYDSPVSVTSLIQDLGWESLQDRRLHLRLTSSYKLVGNMVDIPAQYHPEPLNRPTRGHDKRYQTHQPAVDAYKYSFIPRTIIDWNDLPPSWVCYCPALIQLQGLFRSVSQLAASPALRTGLSVLGGHYVALYPRGLCYYTSRSRSRSGILPYRTVPYRIVSYHIMSCHVMLCHALSYLILSHLIVSYLILSHIIPYHIMSYNPTCHIKTYVISLARWQTMASPTHRAGNTTAYHRASDTISYTCQGVISQEARVISLALW